MASEVVSAKIPDDRREAFEKFCEDRGLNNNQALNRLMDRGLQAYGYDEAGTGPPSMLHRVLTRTGWVTLLVGFSWLVVSLTGAVGWRVPGAVAVAAAGILFAIRRAEPGISRRALRAMAAAGISFGGGR